MIAVNERLSCALIDISLFGRVGLFVARSFTGHAIMWGAQNGVLFKKQVLCVSMKAIIILFIHLTRISPSLREKNVK